MLMAQKQENAMINTSVRNKGLVKDSAAQLHSPKKAAILSAVLPGTGQIYNHQVWKLAIVYGGMGSLAYFIQDNNRIYKDYRQQWIYLTDADTNTNVRNDLYGVSSDALHNAFSSYRKYRDQCLIGFVLVYAANIIDANVYAHLYYFNVDDLSLHFTPNYNRNSQSMMPAFTLRYKF